MTIAIYIVSLYIISSDITHDSVGVAPVEFRAPPDGHQRPTFHVRSPDVLLRLPPPAGRLAAASCGCSSSHGWFRRAPAPLRRPLNSAAAPQPFVPTPAQLFGPCSCRCRWTRSTRTARRLPMQCRKGRRPSSCGGTAPPGRDRAAAFLRFVKPPSLFPRRRRPRPRNGQEPGGAHRETLAATDAPAGGAACSTPRCFTCRALRGPRRPLPGVLLLGLLFHHARLIPDGHLDTARDLVGDFSYMLREYGHIPNGARTYYLSRSQPPMYYLMVGLLAPDPATPGRDTCRISSGNMPTGWGARRACDPAMRDGNVVAMPDGSLLNRYWDAARHATR